MPTFSAIIKPYLLYLLLLSPTHAPWRRRRRQPRGTYAPISWVVADHPVAPAHRCRRLPHGRCAPPSLVAPRCCAGHGTPARAAATASPLAVAEPSPQATTSCAAATRRRPWRRHTGFSTLYFHPFQHPVLNVSASHSYCFNIPVLPFQHFKH